MTVVFIPKGERNVPSSRYRCYQVAEEMGARGVAVKICPPPARWGVRPQRGALRNMARLAADLGQLESDDVLFLQRPLHNTPLVGLIALLDRLRPRRVIFDFCDPVFFHSPRKTRILVRLADEVVASSEDLAVWARQFSRRVHVIPNSVPDAKIVASREDPGNQTKPVIGWVGNASLHQENLRLIFPALKGLRTPAILRIIGGVGAHNLFREIEGGTLDLEIIDWIEPDSVPREIARFDVAVLPLVDILWNRKLITKLVECLASGVPVVASAVGENRRIIRQGDNGFLASSPAEWSAALDRLLGDAMLRRRMGAAALRTAHEGFRLSVNVTRLLDIVYPGGLPETGPRG